MVPVTTTAIPTVAPVLTVVGAISVLRIVDVKLVLRIVDVISLLGVVGVISVLGVVCVMIPDEKEDEKIINNDPQ